MKIKITADQIGLAEGNLYRIHTEDGVGHVFDTQVAAYLGNDVWVLNGFVVKGYYTDDEGFDRPNRNYRAIANALVERILARGVIDTAHWTKLPPRQSFQEREAYNLRCEEEERLGW